MYHIYTTKGCIVGGSHHGEADKSLLVLTSSHGLIRAQAKGVRFLKSKLRFYLQDYSFSQITFVKGRSGWIIKNTKFIEEHGGFLNKEARIIFAKISSLVKTLSPMESENPELFEVVSRAYEILYFNNLSDEEMFALECIAALKILNSLGYLPDDNRLHYFKNNPIDAKTIKLFSPHKKYIVKAINSSLEASHLS